MTLKQILCKLIIQHDVSINDEDKLDGKDSSYSLETKCSKCRKPITVTPIDFEPEYYYIKEVTV